MDWNAHQPSVFWLELFCDAQISFIALLRASWCASIIFALAVINKLNMLKNINMEGVIQDV